MISRHKRNQAEEGALQDAFDLNFNRFSLGCDYSGPLTLRLSRENHQEDPLKHSTPNHSQVIDSHLALHPKPTHTLKDSLRLLEEKLVKVSGQLKAKKPLKKEPRGQMRQTFAVGSQAPSHLEICPEVSENRGPLKAERQTKVWKMVGTGGRGKDYFVGTIIKSVRAPNSNDNPTKNYLNRMIAQMRSALSVEHPSVFELEHRKVNLEMKQKYLGCKTILIELDKTLLNWKTARTCPEDLQVGSPKSSGFISLRPYALSFLRRIASAFEIVVFSRLEKERLTPILEELDPEGKLISGCISLEGTSSFQGHHPCKDLRILNRDLRDMVILESEVGEVVQVGNVVPVVEGWRQGDKELMELERFLLRELGPAGDVRELCLRWFKLDKYWQFQEGEELVAELYI